MAHLNFKIKTFKASPLIFFDHISCNGVKAIGIGNGNGDSTIFPPPMGKIVGQTGLFNLGMATSLGEGKFLTC